MQRFGSGRPESEETPDSVPEPRREGGRSARHDCRVRCTIDESTLILAYGLVGMGAEGFSDCPPNPYHSLCQAYPTCQTCAVCAAYLTCRSSSYALFSGLFGKLIKKLRIYKLHGNYINKNFSLIVH